MSTPEQPERDERDGQLGIQRQDDRLWVSVTQDGEEWTMPLSEFNAWRLFGMLATMLGIPLPARLAKRIKLG